MKLECMKPLPEKASSQKAEQLRSVIRLFALVSAILVMAIFIVVWVASEKLDSSYRQQAVRTAEAAIGQYKTLVTSHAREFAWWDEAIRRFFIEPDDQWVQENFSADELQAYGVYAVLVYSPDGKVVYFSEPAGMEGLLELTPALSNELFRFVTSHDSFFYGNEPLAFNTFFLMGGVPWIVSVARFSPVSNEAEWYRPEQHGGYLVFIGDFANAEMQYIAEQFGMERLRYQPNLLSINHDRQLALPLESWEGSLLGYLVWDTEMPGHQFIRSIGGYFILLVLLLGITTFAVLYELVKVLKRVTQEHHFVSRAKQLESSRTELLKDVSEGKSLVDVLHRLACITEDSMVADGCAIYLKEGDATGMYLAVSPNTPAELIKYITRSLKDINSEVVQTEVLSVTNFEAHPFLHEQARLIHQLGVCISGLHPILNMKGHLQGYLEVFYTREHELSHYDMDVMAANASVAAAILDQHIMKREMENLAFGDSLTGLKNRRLFSLQLEEAVQRARRTRENFALLYIDLDNFKKINDGMGHAAGDSFLCIAAERIVQSVRRTDVPARLGGDEFVVILHNIERPIDAERVARKIVENFNQPFVLNDEDMVISCSIGIALCSEGEPDADQLLKNADLAMYKAKHEGKNNFQFFNEELQRIAREQLELERDLRHALAEDELSLVYQPQVDLASGELVAVEALIRWEHPKKGMISPAIFIPLAEENGFILPVGAWVVRTAIRQLAAWLKAGIICNMSVNVSAKQLMNDDFAEELIRCVEEHGVPPERLEIEITESSLMDDAAGALLVVRKLQSAGFVLAIDDFGTGYSSLGYLRQFQFNKLKIDRLFIRNIVDDPKDRMLTQSITEIAHNLSMKVVVEGIETDEQMEAITGMGADMVQGFLFARPMSAGQFELFMRQHDARLWRKH